MIAVRRLSAAVGLWLAAVATAACELPAGAVAAEPTHGPATQACAGVTVSVEFDQLGAGRRTACVDHGGTAVSLFADAGFRLAYAPNMPDFVCTVDGLPRDGDCTTGSRYWSLWWSQGDHGWTYASLGVKSLQVSRGDSLAFVWHQGSGSAQPPALKLGTTPTTARARPVVSDGGGAGATTWLAIGVGVVAVAGAAAVPVLRRRKAG